MVEKMGLRSLFLDLRCNYIKLHFIESFFMIILLNVLFGFHLLKDLLI